LAVVGEVYIVLVCSLSNYGDYNNYYYLKRENELKE